MIKCPQCNNHNIDDHRFCQQCGTSLTEKTCASCGYMVDLEVIHCPQCNYPTATIWWTILTPASVETEQVIANSVPTEQVMPAALMNLIPDDIEIASEDELSTEDLLNTIEQLVHGHKKLKDTEHELSQSASRTSLLSISDAADHTNWTASPVNPVIIHFLEQNPRYLLLKGSDSLPSQNSEFIATGFNILDTQPFHLSPLAMTLSQWQGTTNTAEMSKPGTLTTFLKAQPLPFPAILEPYLALRQQFPLLLPYVHDAWQSDQQAVVLLENRTGLPTLKEVIDSGSPSSTQILHWLQQTLNLAMACATWGCLSSVLQIDNLKVDQGKLLCLQQLLFDQRQPISVEMPEDKLATPAAFWDDLRYVWLDLLQGLGAIHADPFHLFLTDLKSANEVTQTQLQQYLSKLSEQVPSSLVAETPGSLQQQCLSVEEEGAPPTLILPNQLLHLAAAGQTDDGRDRHHNEDFFVIEQQFQQNISPNQHQISGRGLYILCDGMGGHASGEIASSLAVKTLTQYLKPHWQETLPDADVIKDAIYAANHALFQVNEEKSGSNRMGTTLVMALIQDTHIQIGHVGDSRLYRLTCQYGLEQITVDHEVGQKEIQQGTTPEVAYARPDAYQLTQALGPRKNEVLEPDVQLLTATEDTLLLICSDGLTDNQLLETHCDQKLLPMLNSQVTLQQGVNDLVSLANEHNGHDNITVIAILMRVQPQGHPIPS